MKDLLNEQKKKYSNIVPETYAITNPSDGLSIGFPHYAAVLNTCISGTFGFDFEFVEDGNQSTCGY